MSPSTRPILDTINSSSRFLALDGLRGAAILMVLSWNLVSQMHTEAGSLAAYAQALCRLNWSGVDLFFVLSGFLIGGILLDQRRSRNLLQVFYLRRACRIFPIYFLSLILFLIARSCLDGTSHEWGWLLTNQGMGGKGIGTASPVPLYSYFLYLQNLWMAWGRSWGPGWLGITWSLAVEEQFYLLLPFIILAVPQKKTLIILCAVCAACALFFRMGHEGLSRYCLLPARMDSLMAGVVISCLLRQEGFVLWLGKSGRAIAAFAIVLAVMFAALIMRPYALGVLNHSFLAVFYSTVLLGAVMFPSGAAVRVLEAAPLRWFGRASYGIYLFHEPVIGAAHAVAFNQAPRIHSPAEAAVSVAAMLAAIGLAAVSYEWFERHLIAFGKRHAYEMPDSVTAK
ncbi:acyltransferase [Prosthecobacter sp.]|uniref:acyltransferase family protein n=1 Tax=Prosthecobacter sp. TaxID=1965333 RepID=UPI002AB841E3|nr:acyltransferase [Prosthecobacter sp.]MDZ4401100.1 acyltransferase [Prosthecobacter sp.]